MRHEPEKIVTKSRRVDMLLAQGKTQ